MQVGIFNLINCGCDFILNLTMKRIKIFGAGSIGNHLAHAARNLNYEVVVCDVDEAALNRMKTEIYPSRYGAWDDSIQLFKNADAPRGSFDLIHIGTPPTAHIPLAMQALEENPRAILIEKPLCPPDLAGAEELWQAAQKSDTRVFVGYDHAVGAAAHSVETTIPQLGAIQTLDVEFREHWGGIFAAHPWLDGPQSSYLGYWSKGGGASGEHSHAIHLWTHFAHLLGAGKVNEVDALLEYKTVAGAEYDSLCLMNVRTENGLCGRIVQDVVTIPTRKWARIQGEKNAVEWIANYNPQGDAVIQVHPGDEDKLLLMPKKRPDDFIAELRHIEACLESGNRSPLDLENGLDVMLLIAAAHKSEQEKCRISIDYAQGYNLNALKTASPNNS